MTDPNVIEALDKLARAIECLADADGGEAHVEAVELARDVMLLAAAEKPAESPFPNPVAKRDAEWTRAFAEAVGLDSGLAAPIIPGGVKACIEQLRAEKPAEAALAPDPGAHLHNCPATAMRCRVCPSSGPQACEQVPAPVVTGDIQFDPEGHAISPTTGKPTHVDPDGWFGFANMERAGVYVEARGLESARRAVRAMRDAGIAAVRGVPAPAPVVVPLNPTDFATACLRNSGIDVKCGACMEVAFTGATAAPHTCAMPSSALAEINNIAAHALGIATIHNPSPGFATANVKRLAKEHRALQTAPAPTPAAVPGLVFGEPDAEGETRDCPDCNGTTFTASGNDCATCDGTGVRAGFAPKNAHNAARLKGGE